MIPPRRLLVATDFSAGAECASSTALDLAARWGASIEWVHVCPEASHSLTPSSDALISNYLEHANHEGRAGLQALADLSGKRDVECSVHLESGRPDAVIARCVEETGSDWVVVGTHGRSGVQSLLVGSVALKIVRSSPVPILCVRAGAALGAGGAVVYGEDFGSPENRDAAAGVARSLDAPLVVVHAVELAGGVMADVTFQASPRLIDATVQEAREHLEELSSVYGEGAELEVEFGPAAGAICDQARRRNASLVVTGTASRRGLERWMLGSVAERTLQHAPCSVLVLR